MKMYFKYNTIILKTEFINLKKSGKSSMGGFEGRKGRNVLIIMSKINLK